MGKNNKKIINTETCNGMKKNVSFLQQSAPLERHHVLLAAMPHFPDN